jgi:predicted  nucleic acid-binding Zn-ribbon protein
MRKSLIFLLACNRKQIVSHKGSSFFRLAISLYTGIRLQKKLRSRIKKLVKLRKQYCKDYKKWSKTCSKLGEEKNSIYTEDKTILQLLGTANSISSDEIEQNENSIKTLTDLYKSISKKEQHQSLKSRLQQAHSKVEQINRDQTQHENKRAELEKQLSVVNKKLTDQSLCKSHREKFL